MATKHVCWLFLSQCLCAQKVRNTRGCKDRNLDPSHTLLWSTRLQWGRTRVLLNGGCNAFSIEWGNAGQRPHLTSQQNITPNHYLNAIQYNTVPLNTSRRHQITYCHPLHHMTLRNALHFFSNSIGYISWKTCASAVDVQPVVLRHGTRPWRRSHVVAESTTSVILVAYLIWFICTSFSYI